MIFAADEPMVKNTIGGNARGVKVQKTVVNSKFSASKEKKNYLSFFCTFFTSLSMAVPTSQAPF